MIDTDERRRDRYDTRASGIDPVPLMAMNGVVGGLTGFVIWVVTDAVVLLPAFLAAGPATGTSATQSRRSR